MHKSIKNLKYVIYTYQTNEHSNIMATNIKPPPIGNSHRRGDSKYYEREMLTPPTAPDR